MKMPRLGINSAIFLLFFGIALIDAIQAGPWWRALFWVAVGTGFLLADYHRSAP